EDVRVRAVTARALQRRRVEQRPPAILGRSGRDRDLGGRREVSHEEREVGHVVLQLVAATGAVVVLPREVVVGPRLLIVGTTVDDRVGRGPIGAVLGGEGGVRRALAAVSGGDAHLVQIGVRRELGQVRYA